jgi:hypothetical protein
MLPVDVGCLRLDRALAVCAPIAVSDLPVSALAVCAPIAVSALPVSALAVCAPIAVSALPASALAVCAHIPDVTCRFLALSFLRSIGGEMRGYRAER